MMSFERWMESVDEEFRAHTNVGIIDVEHISTMPFDEWYSEELTPRQARDAMMLVLQW